LRTIKPTYKQCAQGGLTLIEIASMMDITKERVRQIETRALLKLRRNVQAAGLNPTILYRD